MIGGLIIGFLLGNMLGVIVGYMLAKTNIKTVGSLRIDKSDPDDGPYLFLELETDPSIIERKSQITLKVNAKNYISQK